MEQIYINNVNLHSSIGAQSVYAITGCAAATADADPVATEMNTTTKRPKATNVYTWTQASGTKASTTGTIYGIYDMSGGTWERTAAIVNNGNDSGNLNTYGKAIMNALNNGKSSEYVTVYPTGESKGQSIDDASKFNYAENTKKYGDAVLETSQKGIGSNSSAVYYGDYSNFPALYGPFFYRGGGWDGSSNAGLFAFRRSDGTASYDLGFRAVLV